jgi:glycosyltransferase involved in cell wall biosynthesis
MSPDIEQCVLDTQSQDRVMMIPNMADCEYYHPQEKPQNVVSQYEVEGKFVISYVGTAGRANQLEYLLEAAKVCSELSPQIQFLLASSGRELEKIKVLITAYNLKNIRIVEYLDREGVKNLLSITDAIYVSFANVPILASGSPNKLFDGLAAGKLIITNFGGWTKGIIEKYEAGFSYHPEESNTFAEQLTPYLESEELLLKTKANARQLAEQYYSRKGLIKEWMRLFDIK